MSDSSRVLSSLLGPAVGAARAALRRLEPEEVPAALRRVAAYAGGRLPPPLLTSLLEQLDASEWLRAKAAEELAGDGADEISRAFLERPDGWALQLAGSAAGLAAEAAVREREAAERKAEAVEEKLAEARRRLREAAAPGGTPVDPQVDEVRGKLKEARRDAEKAIAALESRLADVGEELVEAELAARTEAADAQRLRSRLRRTRRQRAALEAELRGLEGGGAVGRSGPVELAQRLDHTARTARPSPAVAPETPARTAPVLELPSGVRPDTAQAIDWLVGLEQPALVLVDGYNVTFALSERGFATAEARGRLEAALARLATINRALRVGVVYDSDRGGDVDVRAGPGGIEVVFAPAERLADEELVARASAAALPTVVISTDREVREGAEAAGAMALWGEALVRWIRRRS